MSWIKAIIKIGRNLLKPGKSLSQKVVRSTFWMGAFKVTERTLRFIRTIIVARLLSPTDFGLFGLACLAMDILERFSETGMNAALIQKKEKTEEYLDTAWTINLIRNIFLFSLLFFGAPFIAKFFNNLSAAPLIRVIAVIMIVRGLTNIGAVYFIKEFDFRKQFVLRTVGIIVNVVVTLTLAFILRNAWALVWGYLAQNIANCTISYILHPYRPKLRIELPKAKGLLNFGKWIFGSSILIFLVSQGDDILVGKVLGLTALGLYQMAYAISNLPATEITHVISQVTFPAYSKLQDNLPKLREAYLKVLQLTAFVSFPIAGLIFALAPDFTRLFLSEKWMPMVPAMRVLTLYGLIRSIGATNGALFTGSGNPRFDTIGPLIHFVFLVIFIYPLTKLWGIEGTSWATLIAIFASQIYSFTRVLKIIPNISSDYFKAILFPLGGSLLILLVYSIANQIFSVNIFTFVINLSVVVCLYICVMWAYSTIDRNYALPQNIFNIIRRILI